MGASLDFDATDKISVGAVNPLDGVSTASWSFWIRWDDASDLTQYYFGKNFGTAFNLALDVSRIICRIDGTGGTMIRRSSSGDASGLVSDQWYNIAWTWDYNGGTQLVDLYMDGVLKTTTYAVTADISAMDTGTGDLQIGDSNLNATYDFAGKMAYVQLYDRRLSIEEVNEIMHKPDLILKNNVGYWRLLTTAPADLSGVGNDGTNTGTAVDPSGPPVFFP